VTPPTRPGILLERTLSSPAWALVRLAGDERVTLLGGRRDDHELLSDIPLETEPPGPGRRFDRLVCVPFAQIRERGFAVHEDQTPLCSIAVELEAAASVEEIETLASLDALRTSGRCGFVVGDDEYAALVQTIISDEIGTGEGANLVIARDYVTRFDNWNVGQALGVFCRLLRQERGAYWTFLVFTGDRYLVGASPERHVRLHSGEVSMNPISGTFRLREQPESDGLPRAATETGLAERLVDFLGDRKEIFELFMVVDEELKMMCALCSGGGSITGPFLKPMSHLIHTEYLLSGRSALDPRAVLRDSMFAATVTGSPVENACRLIAKYESGGRGYYGAVLALLGRDRQGQPTVDAPIVLRTAEVSPDGRLRVTAGATLVRDSDPRSEVAETHAKAAGILSAFGLVPAATTGSADVTELVEDPTTAQTLAARNERLSRFWLTDQSGATPSPALAGRRVVVLDGEDDFVAMLRHMFSVLGMSSVSLSHRDYRPGAFDGADLVVVGPGPGDPRQLGDPKIATVRSAVDSLLRSRQPFLAVCLGHQVLCGALGLDLGYKDIVFQGTQTRIGILGREENVGFYNTFVARVPFGRSLPDGVSVDVDPESGDVHLLRGPHFVGVQFHAESILTEHGFDLVHEIVGSLLTVSA